MPCAAAPRRLAAAAAAAGAGARARALRHCSLRLQRGCPGRPLVHRLVVLPCRAEAASGSSQAQQLQQRRRYAVGSALRRERAYVFALATEYRQEAAILQRSARRLGYRLKFVGVGDPWVGWGTKLIQYRRALAEGLQPGGGLRPDDPVMLLDGWDTALIGPAEEFCEKMAGLTYGSENVPWYAGERICGPDFFVANRLDAVLGDPGTPWRYPNAGAMAGRAAAVLHLMEALLEGQATADGQPFPKDGNDQGRLHEHLLDLGERGEPLPYLVDSRCGLFQCLYEREPQWELYDPPGAVLPRLRNTLTGESPLVLHGNGHTGRWFMSGLWREMDFLRRVGLSPEDLAHLPFDGPVAPGSVPDAATERNWLATFQIYQIIEQQLAYARLGITWDPWKEAEQAAAAQGSQSTP
eukprot:TRINITY_DN39354_c0_g1_i1.p1 TRINITY_DN39354_c0_g1~~TRINITY_DN39354_c0_g1_i1.p1  ORF type:complete len:453 (+),score=68.17 TRINITY_DN39354_c0_g1_i1:131-1360(+)